MGGYDKDHAGGRTGCLGLVERGCDGGPGEPPGDAPADDGVVDEAREGTAREQEIDDRGRHGGKGRGAGSKRCGRAVSVGGRAWAEGWGKGLGAMVGLMSRVLTVAECRVLDARAVAAGVPSLLLMEHAALGLARVVRQVGGADASVTVLVGKGNNGGDGLALARLISASGGFARCLTLYDAGGWASVLEGDCRVQHGAALAVGVSMETFSEGCSAERGGVVVDAMFGTGLVRPLSGLAAGGVGWIGGCRSGGAVVVAADVPSGVDADTGETAGPAVVSDHTVMFGGAKPGLVCGAGSACAGRLWLGGLGLPAAGVESLGRPLTMTESSRVTVLVPVWLG